MNNGEWWAAAQKAAQYWQAVGLRAGKSALSANKAPSERMDGSRMDSGKILVEGRRDARDKRGA